MPEPWGWTHAAEPFWYTPGLHQLEVRPREEETEGCKTRGDGEYLVRNKMENARLSLGEQKATLRLYLTRNKENTRVDTRLTWWRP